MTDVMVVAMIGAGAAIAGGVVAGLLSGAYQHLRDWLSRPKLRLDFSDASGACKIEAAWKDSDTGKVVERVIIRASLNNVGRQSAINCQVHLYNVEEVLPGGQATPAKFYDSRPLPWAGRDFQRRDIPSVVTHYVDIVRVRKDVSGWDFTFERTFSSDKALRDYRGAYRFSLVVTADNAKPSYCTIDADYNGDWHNFRASKRN